ncbi:4Fe-4S ferredoxin iron-sulfur binding domain-containing protein [Thermodesulfobium narugense DSM 14796]|uniref:4Fe-4S ferredoxin iron-sulfur binding domain-containing protein n=1 Tax=Thermodesulfobium narugense DSM 14796 TaxID=747365 RepID=M1E850_9BACT|nr:4Fe-4S dicluster domain-containing protein [Thermodesulfobium narugense]AEE14760.1 4Fe-4S ferredoxin iron-sulfur binding domain-containing protein [Thermodesulfobium narugense DSM 14796]
MERVAYMFDSSKCMGCRGCQSVCKQWNDQKTDPTTFTGFYTNPPSLNPHTRMIINFYDDFTEKQNFNFLKYQCFHCGEPACVKACPSGALFQAENGIVAFDVNKCIACGYCHSACPFGIPQIGKVINKCDMCYSRVIDGSKSDETSTPACVKACLGGALYFGKRDDLVKQGKERVEVLKKEGFTEANLYGENILGGLGVLSILKYEPEKYGLPKNPVFPANTLIWKNIMHPLGLVMLGGAAGLVFLHRLIQAGNKGGDQ